MIIYDVPADKTEKYVLWTIYEQNLSGHITKEEYGEITENEV